MYRNQRMQIILVAWIGLLTVFCETSLATTAVKVFLLGGQSNMNGWASQSGLPTALQNPQADVLFYARAGTPGIGGTLTSLQPGSTRSDGFGTQFGPEVTFGRSLADALPGENFALIKHASDGTNLENHWDPNTGGVYASFQNTVADGLAALTAAGHPTEIVGMLWLQGEWDALNAPFANAYEANLTEFIADVRNEYGADLPFLIGQLSINQTFLNSTFLATVRQAQADVDNALANTALIVSDSSPLASDNLHFNPAGQIALGNAFAAAALPFVIPDLLGDFDNDEDVDGADFLAWQRDTSIGNLADWQENFGTIAAVAAATEEVTSVPEPSTLCLAFLGLALLTRLAIHANRTKMRTVDQANTG